MAGTSHSCLSFPVCETRWGGQSDFPIDPLCILFLREWEASCLSLIHRASRWELSQTEACPASPAATMDWAVSPAGVERLCSQNIKAPSWTTLHPCDPGRIHSRYWDNAVFLLGWFLFSRGQGTDNKITN